MAAPGVEETGGDELDGRPGPSLWGVQAKQAGGRGRTRQRLLFEIGAAALTLGVLVVLFVAYDLWGTGIAEGRSQVALARQFGTELHRSERLPAAGATGVPAGARDASNRSSAPAQGHRPAPAEVQARRPLTTGGAKGTARPGVPGATRPVVLVPPPGGALDHLLIPAIGVDRYVVQGVDEADLQMGPGHYPGTALPGQAGNVAIAGHRTTFGAPFFDLNALKAGDFVYITDTSGTTWVYRVQRQWVVAPTDVAVLTRTRTPELTLTTCNPRFEATTRLVVRAALAGRIAAGAKLAKGLALAAGAPAAPPHHQGKSTAVAAVAAPAPRVPAGQDGGPTAAGGVHDPAVSLPGTSTPAPVLERSTTPSLARPPAGAWSWVGAAGWGLLALMVWTAARVAGARRRRWAKLGTVGAGALVALVPVWFLFENLVRLLPANF